MPKAGRWTIAAGAGALALGFVLATALRPLVEIGTAYKAKMVCSGVFVARRPLSAVLEELQVDDLAALRHVEVSLDEATRSVSASAFGLVARRAAYREGLGCALVPDAFPLAGADRGPAAADPIRRVADGMETPKTSGGRTTAELDAVLESAFSEPDPRRPRRTLAVVVVHRGRLVSERYATGLGPQTPLPGWSMAKGVVNALVGVLVRQGRLSLTGPVPVAAWQGTGDARARITLDQLLRMSSGLRFDEGMTSLRSDVVRMLLASADTARYAAAKPLAARPGTVWSYSSGTTNIVSGIIREVLGRSDHYLSFPRRALFDRVGMTTAVLEADAAGTFVGSSYLYASARDWARFGLLYLEDGVWQGDRILPEGWVRYTTTPAPAAPDGSYGAHFWLRIPEEYRGSEDGLPADAYHAVGHEGQFVTIVPSRAAVIVRLGRTRQPKAWDHAAFVKDVLDALERGAAG